MLVRKVGRVDGAAWYEVQLAMRPSGGIGWVQADSVGVYVTVAQIVIDVSARRLTVYRDGKPGETLRGPLLQFPTRRGESLVLIAAVPRER